MRTSWHELWGCARGPIKRLAPQTRLLAGDVTFAACLVTPAATIPGSLVAVVATAAWLLACRPPPGLVRQTALAGLVLFLPYFLLLPLIPADPASATPAWASALVVPWSVLLRGMSGMLVSMATVASVSASDLRDGLGRLPVPRVVSAILLQIVHQTATLLYETRRVGAAMAVRGATSGSLTAWRVLSSLPQVWLPRVIGRAERVAAAMELRGYCETDLEPSRSARTRLADGAALLLAVGVLALAVLVRRWGAG